VEVALLTIYDICKAVDRAMAMSDFKLLEKNGGKSGEWQANINSSSKSHPKVATH